MRALEEHLQARPPAAVTLRLSRFRKNTAGRLVGGMVSAALGLDSEGDTGDDRPPGLDLGWHDATGRELQKDRLHPYATEGFRSDLRSLSALPLEGVRVQHAIGDELFDTWTPGHPLLRAELPAPGPPRAALEELGWSVDFDGAHLVAAREWPVSAGKLAKVTRLVRGKSEAPARRELRAGPAGLTLVEDEGEAPVETHLPRAEIRCALLVPGLGSWNRKQADKLALFLGPARDLALAATEPGSRFSTTKTREEARAAVPALHALVLLALARAA